VDTFRPMWRTCLDVCEQNDFFCHHSLSRTKYVKVTAIFRFVDTYHPMFRTCLDV